jgi:aspartyl-tRNA(Asn)/glutamyl-tRNA(Gln) amidotransferase subunit A
MPDPTPSTDDLPFLTIAEVGALFRSRQLSPVELTQLMLDRIERLNPILNAYLTVTGEWALERARQAEAELGHGLDRGPLHGIPLGIKDLYDTAGLRTTAGSPALADNVPLANAAAVDRLLQDGAVILGKQHMQEFAHTFARVHPALGEIHNPWALDRVPGGSSGGTASAIAAGLGFGGLGSDTGGSIRVPSAFCGISGIKPTYGRVSVRGVIPLSWTFDHAGPMARTAADCALLLNAIAGYDRSDPYSASQPTDDYAADLGKPIAGRRLGLIADFREDPAVQPDVGAAFDTAVAVLRAEGALVSETRLPLLDAGRSAFGPTFIAELAAIHLKHRNTRLDLVNPHLAEAIQRGAVIPGLEVANALRVRQDAIRACDQLLEQFDALVCPTTPIVAPPIATANDGTNPYGRFTQPFNITGLPALSVPCGFDENGLPVGLMIVGRRWGERAVLQIGDAYQRVTEWLGRGPDLTG